MINASKLAKSFLPLMLLLNFSAVGAEPPKPLPANAKNPNFTPQYNAYVAKLRSKMTSAWNYPDGKNHVVIQCLVSADGAISEFQIASTPTNAQAEDAANQAFNQAQPLDSLPGNAAAARLTLTFESNASQHSSSANIATKLDPIGKTPANP